MTSPTTAAEYEAAQRAEWGTYVARVRIDYYGVRAYNPGDPVPVSAVDGDGAWVNPDFIDRQATAYEGSATVPPPEPPAIDETTTGAPAAASPDPITTTEG
jgi:hypothetical protein